MKGECDACRPQTRTMAAKRAILDRQLMPEEEADKLIEECRINDGALDERALLEAITALCTERNTAIGWRMAGAQRIEGTWH